MTPLKRFFSLLRQDRKDLAYLYTYASLNGLINLTLPVGIQAIMGFVLAGRISSSWVILTMIVMVGVALAGGFQVMQLYIVEILQRRLFARAAYEFAFRIPRFRTFKLSQRYAPELVNRFFDTVTIQKSLSKVLMDFSTSILQIFFGLLLLSLYHPIFIAFGVALILVLWLIIYVTGKPGLQTSLKESNHKYEMAHWLTELARALPTFKLSSNSDLNLTKTDDIVNKYVDSRKKHFRILLRQYGSVVALKTIVTTALLIVGGLLLIQNSITIGQFVASEIIIILVLNSSEKFIMSMEAIYDIVTSVEKLGNVTDVEIEQETKDGICLESAKALSLEFKDLQIIGARDGLPLGSPVSAFIPASSRLCISGKSGTGKSSLIKIISTGIDNYEGNLLYDNVPIQSLNLNDLRRSVGCIFDDQDIFHGTFIENISLGRRGVTERDVIRLTQLVGLDSLVQTFPDGYQQVIVDAAKVFSSTDRIKLLVARALIGKPRLILMEDLFSSLDVDNRDMLLELLWQVGEQCTLVIVSNNTEIQKRCDTVLELK